MISKGGERGCLAGFRGRYVRRRDVLQKLSGKENEVQVFPQVCHPSFFSGILLFCSVPVHLHLIFPLFILFTRILFFIIFNLYSLLFPLFSLSIRVLLFIVYYLYSLLFTLYILLIRILIVYYLSPLLFIHYLYSLLFIIFLLHYLFIRNLFLFYYLYLFIRILFSSRPPLSHFSFTYLLLLILVPAFRFPFPVLQT